ncbi:MAG: hypothetical protein ACXABX_09500, partial [Candidatus Thorarchaeota archaeon]
MAGFSQRSLVFSIGILLSITLLTSQIGVCDADIADTASFRVGGTMSNSSLEMLRADAKIRILHTQNDGIKIDVSCNFEVIPSEPVNASLAFVYPEYWHLYSGNSVNIGFDITVNDTPVEHTTVGYSYLIDSGYVLNSTDMGGTWIESAEFVMFNYEMQVGETYNIRLTTTAFPMTSNHYASFSYFIGSAKTFQGQTHQTVEMHVVEEKSFVEFSFHPDQFLTESSNSSGTTAVWDLVIDQNTNISQVGFSATINRYTPVLPLPIGITEIIIIGGSILMVIAITIVVRRKN